MKTVLLIAGFLIAAAFAFVYGGIFNVAADAPHSAFTYTIMETVRSRSIATRARDLQPPPLDDATLIAAGARHYAAMCSDCHLAPDRTTDSEIRAGLYPKPPDLTKHLHASPAEAFWVIKHGIKMSGMPAWGLTHDDSAIWGLVAFLQKLPELTAAQYQALAETEETSHHQQSHDRHRHAVVEKK
jgi:mono/diheme cytochrome c family protein